MSTKSIENQINKIYNNVWKKLLNKERINALSKGSSIPIELAIIKLKNSISYNEFAKKFSKELAKKGLNNQKGIWRKYFEAAKKIKYIALPKTFKEFEEQTYKKAVQNNFNMITTLPDKVLEVVKHKYTSNLIEEVIKGTRNRGSFEKELKKHGSTNSKVIARTETAKLQTLVLENRAIDLGSVAYIWLASNDKRTRPSHRNMNGVVVFWKFEKPHLDNMIGHAGEFPNCRCSPQPILDIDEITKSNYRVWDYHTNKIINISKNDLIAALERGYL